MKNADKLFNFGYVQERVEIICDKKFRGKNEK